MADSIAADASPIPASGACNKVQAWLLSTHLQSHASVNGPEDLCSSELSRTANCTASVLTKSASLGTATCTAICDPIDDQPAASCSYDSFLQQSSLVPAFPGCKSSMPSTESLSASPEASPRCADDSKRVPGSSIRRMLSHLQRTSAGATASAQDMPSLRCPPMSSAVTSGKQAATAAPPPSKLPLLSGPLARTDAVQEQVSKLFLQQPAPGQVQAATSPEPTAAWPIQDTHPHLRSLHNSMMSVTSVQTEPAHELDVSSTAGSSVMNTPSPRSLLVNALDVDGEPRPYHGAPKPSWDESRVAALRGLRQLDTMPEPRFDRITDLVAELLGTPMAVMVLIEDQRQFFRSSVGFGGVTETCRSNSFCAWSLLSAAPECLVVPNALSDARFANNPFVVNPPALRTYISAPLVASNGGARLGTVCVLDGAPRHYTAQDCMLLCNVAELAVRELEAWHADQRLAYAAHAGHGDGLRSMAAWDVGILVITIRDGQWTIKHANDRCRTVLGVPDLGAAVIGCDFWDLFAARGGCGAAAAAAARERGFEADVRCYTAAGRKHWLTAAFRPAGSSWLDAESPAIGFPMDIANEPGLHRGTWFVTLRPMATTPRGLPAQLQPDAAAAAAAALEPLPMHEAFSAQQLQGLHFGAHIAHTLTGELLHALPGCSGDTAAQHAQHRGAGDSPAALAELYVAAEPAAVAAEMEQRQQRWRAAGMAPFAPLDTVRIELGEGALLAVRSAPSAGAISVRTAIHDGMLRTPYKAGVPPAVDIPRVLDAFMHAARGLQRLHASGAAHGDISDATLLLATPPDSGSPAITFATLGRVGGGGAAAAEGAAEVRRDLPVFAAPETAAGDAATAAADVWAMGIVLAYCLRPCLPHVEDGPLSLQARARDGTLLPDVLQLPLGTLPAELAALVTACARPDAARRPSAGQLLKSLQHIRAGLAPSA
eukprot:jgi/Ulvmu1/11736/UM008_0149.1